jgi:hypothetical protein
MLAPLSKLKGIFDLKDCEDKPYFPYLFNTHENKDIVLPNLPDPKYYCPETMKPAEYKKFMQWYEKNRETPFNLQRELYIYGENDTKLLLSAIIEFRSLILQITKGIYSFF